MINVNFKAELRKVSLREFSKKDGTKGFAYPMMIETQDSSYNVNTNVDVYNAFVSGKIEKGNEYIFQAEYEPRFQYNNFNVVGYEDIK